MTTYSLTHVTCHSDTLTHLLMHVFVVAAQIEGEESTVSKISLTTGASSMNSCRLVLWKESGSEIKVTLQGYVAHTMKV